MQPTLKDITEIARGAGAILRAGYGKQHQIEFKGEIDLVTEVDHQSEEYLLKELSSRFPGHRIITEETGEHAGSADDIWYVDPLDGTINYSHGLPIFCVSLAYEHKGELTLAAVFDPMSGEMYAAELGRGATLNGEPIHPSTQTELKASLLVTGFPYDAWINPVNNFAEFERFSRRTQGVRRLGSAALDLCYVAAGRFDGFWEIRLNAWDVAGGALIAAEAGALVTNISGERGLMTKPHSVIAANPTLHTKIFEILRQSEIVKG